MKEIDWRKAPEGATGAMVADFEEASEGIYRGSVEFLGYAGADDRDVYEEGDGAWIFCERPKPWSGEGLPPVGLKVEGLIQGNGDWCELTLKYKSTDFSVFERADGEEFPLWNPQYSTFRPLRTPGQIAAEEREKAIEEMFNAIHPGDRQSAIVNGFYAAIKKHLGDIYDAGYRKQVQQ